MGGTTRRLRLMILLGLSVPHFKRAYYVLPMVPMFAAVAAYGLLQAPGWLSGVRRCYEGLIVALPALCVVVVFVCRHGWQKQGYWPDVSLPLLIGVLAVLQVAALIAWRRVGRLVWLSLIALMAQWLLLVTVVEPARTCNSIPASLWVRSKRCVPRRLGRWCLSTWAGTLGRCAT